MDRRVFMKQMLTSVTSFALMDALFAYNAINPKIKPIIDHWALRLHEYCLDLDKQQLTPEQWQQKIEELFNRIPLQELLEFISFQKLIKGFEFPDLGVHTKKVFFPKLTGLPEKTIFIKKIFGMKKDRAIIPHGHSNMASAHLLLQGEMHLRHYERIHQEENSLIIKPTIDKIIKSGDSSSISDDKNNIHWFIAKTPMAFTFDVIMINLNKKAYDIHNLDMDESIALHNGTLKVPILDVNTALKKYGKHHH